MLRDSRCAVVRPSRPHPFHRDAAVRSPGDRTLPIGKLREVHMLLGLGVESQHVVHGQVEGLDWGFEFKGSVRSVPVVTVEPGLEMLLAVG